MTILSITKSIDYINCQTKTNIDNMSTVIYYIHSNNNMYLLIKFKKKSVKTNFETFELKHKSYFTNLNIQNNRHEIKNIYR